MNILYTLIAFHNELAESIATRKENRAILTYIKAHCQFNVRPQLTSYLTSTYDAVIVRWYESTRSWHDTQNSMHGDQRVVALAGSIHIVKQDYSHHILKN